MPEYRYVTLDVFTSAPFGGNQLAVFPDAGGIPEGALLQIAREFNYSETTFCYPPADLSHAARVRIFTPGAEVPPPRYHRGSAAGGGCRIAQTEAR